jgi:hypothetical protein
MADLKFTIDADYAKASKAFKDLASESEATRERIEKFSNSFSDEKINKFIDKQKLLIVSLTGTKGEMAAMTAAQKNYEKEIEKLIRSGLDPESKEIKKLRAEHEKLKTHTDAQTKSTGNLKNQITASIPAIGAAVAAYQAMSGAFRSIKQFMDDSIRAYTEQEKANARLEAVLFATGSAAWTTSEQLKSFATELANDTGNSAKDIQDLQSVLLGFKSITGDVFNESTEAIVQMAGVMGGDLKSAANTFGKALDTPIAGMTSLSRYGFVFTEQEKEMVKQLEETGKHQEAQKIILDAMKTSFGNAASAVNEAVKSQNDYSTAVENFKIAGGESFEKAVTPVRNFFTSIIQHAADSIKKTNETREAIENLKKQAAGEVVYEEGTSGWVKNVQDNIKQTEKEIQRLNSAIVTIRLEDYLDEESYRAAVDGMAEKISNLEKSLVLLRGAEESLIKTREDEQKRAAEEAAEAANRAVMAEAEAEAQKKFTDEQKKATDTLNQQTQKHLDSLDELKIKNDDIKNDEKQLLQLQLDRAIASINASKAEETAKETAIEAARTLYEEQIRLSEEKFNAENDLLVTRLKEMGETEAQIRTETAEEQLNIFTSFLTARADAEQLDGEERITYFENQKNILLEQMKLSEDEKLSLIQASNDLQKKEAEELSNAQIAIKKAEVSAMAGLFGELSGLVEAAGKDNVAAAIASKALAATEAAINSALAFTKALASAPPPTNLILAGAALAAGIAQQVKIISTPIPSAETGGRFIVPHSVGSDSTYMKVNSNEEVEITPRGQVGFNNRQNIIVQIEKQVLFDVMNDGIRSGDILVSAVNF